MKAFKTSMMLEDASKWKPMADLSQYSVMGNPNLNRLYLSPESISVFEEEERLEADLKHLLKKHRDSKKFFTRFDDNLACVLATALQSYEVGKLTGASVSSESFQAGIKNLVPEGHLFKACPLQVNHKNPVSIFALLSSNPAGDEIMNTIGDAIAFSIRVKIVQYPEDVCAVWTILGVHFIEI